MVISLMINVVDSMINTVFSRRIEILFKKKLIRFENEVVLANLAVAHFFVWSLKLKAGTPQTVKLDLDRITF